MGFTSIIARRFGGVLAELQQSWDNVRQAIKELQDVPVSRGKLVVDVELADSTETQVHHGLGRSALVLVSPPRGGSSTGRIEEVRSSSHNRSQWTALKATGWGATVTVDVWLY